MKTYIFTYCLAFLFSLGLTPLVIVLAKKQHLVDEPNVRKVHTSSIARLGGIAIFIGTMLAILPVLMLPNIIGEKFRTVDIVVLLMTSALVFGIGLYDDLKQARIRTKLIVEILAALIVLGAGIRVQTIYIKGLPPINLGLFGSLITFCWIIGITNAINLIDGLDGLAAGISAIACCVIAILSIMQGTVILAVIMLALVGSLSGFLLFNFHPARIFMGDCGSLFLGFMIATTSVLTASKAEALVGIGLPILVLGIPILDTIFTVIRRFLRRRAIMSPDRGHFHHRLIDRGLKQHHVAIIAYLITAGVTSIGFFMLITRSTISIIIFLFCLTLLLFVFRIVGAVRLREFLIDIRKRSEISQSIKLEQKGFEDIQLQFQNVDTFEQWWDCMCKAALALNFSRLSLQLATKENTWKKMTWNNGFKHGTKPNIEEIMKIDIPLKDRRHGKVHRINVDILTNGSLESAARRVTLFSRLAEEFGPDMPTRSRTV